MTNYSKLQETSFESVYKSEQVTESNLQELWKALVAMKISDDSHLPPKNKKTWAMCLHEKRRIVKLWPKTPDMILNHQKMHTYHYDCYWWDK